MLSCVAYFLSLRTNIHSTKNIHLKTEKEKQGSQGRIQDRFGDVESSSTHINQRLMLMLPAPLLVEAFSANAQASGQVLFMVLIGAAATLSGVFNQVDSTEISILARNERIF